MTTIRLADLDPTGHTSFSFYDLLPGNQVVVEGAPEAADALVLATQLLRNDLLEANDEQIDRFAALVVTHGHLLPPLAEFKELADATARGFAALIGNEAMRPRRMRLTRLSLMLRVVLDRTESTAGVLSDTALPCKSPWDFIAKDGSAEDGWAATCDENNVRRIDAGICVWGRRLELPTQLDRLGDDLWVGSHYSDGGFIVSQVESAEPHVLAITHSCPLVLVFDWGGKRYAVDSRGVLGRLTAGQVGPSLLQLPGKVHRARIIGDSLYAFDWGQAGVGFRIDLQTLQVATIRTGDIIVCNDICAAGESLYGICKLQGRVFKMTHDWTPVSTRLGAGTGPGQLLDPIMIRGDGDVLSVVNWFSSRMVRLPVF
ncbi:MAG: hypothetical protein V4669_10720 [Pseudomonadota bacterium]